MVCLRWLRGTGLALAGRLGGGGAFALRARDRVIAFNARSSPVPLPLRVGGDGPENKNGGPALEGRTAVIEIVQEFLSQP